jgi:GNAT superfamily N-acetyltransferase
LRVPRTSGPGYNRCTVDFSTVEQAGCRRRQMAAPDPQRSVHDMDYTIAELKEADEPAVVALALSSFMEFVAPTFDPKGVDHVRGDLKPGALLRDNLNEHFCLVAKREDRITGMIQARPPGHIAKLYVDRNHHRQGIARELLDAAIQRLRELTPDVKELTVNSSRCAVPAYTRLGFRIVEPEQKVWGYRITKMARELKGTERNKDW